MKKLVMFVMLLMSMPAAGLCQQVPGNSTVRRMDGTEVQMKDALGEGVVIMSFWATWCKPCQNELTALAEIEESWAGKVRVIAVSVDDSRAAAKVRSLVSGNRWPFEVLLDQNRTLYKALNLSSIPFVMIIRDGKTLYSHTGYTPGSERLVVEKALEYAAGK